jgi:glycosyltransferase involved in cell wall biosynthesis
MHHPFFSLIMATYNESDTIMLSLNSIKDQTYGNWELIIMDGDSTDGIVDIIKENAQWIKYWESRPDRGISHAWNKALEHVEVDWIYFLGADDRFSSKDILNNLVL